MSARELERQKTRSSLGAEAAEEAAMKEAEAAVDYSATKVPHFKVQEEEPDDGFPSVNFDEDVEIVKFKYFPQVGKLVSCFAPKRYSGRSFTVFRKMFTSTEFKNEMNAFIRAAEYSGVPYDKKIYKEMLMPWNNTLMYRAKQEILKRQDEPLNHRVSQMIAKFQVPDGYKIYKKTDYAHRLILDFGVRVKKINPYVSSRNASIATQVMAPTGSTAAATTAYSSSSAFTGSIIAAATTHVTATEVVRQDKLAQSVLDKWTFTPNSSEWRTPGAVAETASPVPGPTGPGNQPALLGQVQPSALVSRRGLTARNTGGIGAGSYLSKGSSKSYGYDGYGSGDMTNTQLLLLLDNSDDEDDDDVPLTTFFYCCANDACRKKVTVIPIKKFVPKFPGQIDREPECANVFAHLQEKHWNMLLQCGYTVDPRTGQFTGDLKRLKNTKLTNEIGL